METSTYNELKERLSELNKINDEINFIEWNKDDGPKFSSIEEMKQFESQIFNGKFDFIFDEDSATPSGEMIKTYEIDKDNYSFYIYTFKRNDDFITYMTIKNLQDNNVLEHLYGNKTTDEDKALSYSEKLNSDISNNTLDYIFENIIVDINNNINKLKKKYEELTSES